MIIRAYLESCQLHNAYQEGLSIVEVKALVTLSENSLIESSLQPTHFTSTRITDKQLLGATNSGRPNSV